MYHKNGVGHFITSFRKGYLGVIVFMTAQFLLEIFVSENTQIFGGEFAFFSDLKWIAHLIKLSPMLFFYPFIRNLVNAVMNLGHLQTDQYIDLYFIRTYTGSFISSFTDNT